MKRHEAREVAFIIIFEKGFQADAPVDALIEAATESEFFEVNNFVTGTVTQVFAHLGGIDQIIDDNLVGWSASRISKVARAVLRLAVYEILYSDVPDGVAINEAVEITKKYSVQEEASYVNGVLGTIARSKNA
ncbi:MAG: transcription antitermination factor NusB [Clostridia bacterium]|nr:transcription antitermination factor NusB [Clostridia bacterium]MBR3552408.1 transcription antitermination factor NusB [Clostridia bacterium]